MERTITKNADGTYKVVESSVTENVTREQLAIFRDRIDENIQRLEKDAESLKKQREYLQSFLKE